MANTTDPYNWLQSGVFIRNFHDFLQRPSLSKNDDVSGNDELTRQKDISAYHPDDVEQFLERCAINEPNLDNLAKSRLNIAQECVRRVAAERRTTETSNDSLPWVPIEWPDTYGGRNLPIEPFLQALRGDFPNDNNAVSLPVVLVTTTASDSNGTIATLSLEWFPVADGRSLEIFPHPDLYLMPMTDTFVNSVETAARWALREKCSLVSGILYWNVKWAEDAPKTPAEDAPETSPKIFEKLDGESLGLATAIGCFLRHHDTFPRPHNIVFTGKWDGDKWEKVEYDHFYSTNIFDTAKWRAVRDPNAPVNMLVVIRRGEPRTRSDSVIRSKSWRSVRNFDEALKIIDEQDIWEQKIRRAISLSIRMTPSIMDSKTEDSKARSFVEDFVMTKVTKERYRIVPRPNPSDRDPDTRSSGYSVRWPLEQGELALHSASEQPVDEKEILFREAVTETSENNKGKAWRVVLMGPPGAGKSTLLWEMVWHMGEHDPPLPEKIGMEDLLLPGFIPLRDWGYYSKQAKFNTGSTKDDQRWRLAYVLHNVLLDMAKTGEANVLLAPDSMDHWYRCLEAGHVLLTLDGLDELTSESDLNTLNQALASVPKCPVIVSVRSVSRNRLREIGFPERIYLGDANDGPTAIYRVLYLDSEEQQNIIIDRALDNPEKRLLVRHRIEGGQFSEMAGNPLLLLILCYVARELPKNVEFPSTRTALYRQVVRTLVEKELLSVPFDEALLTEDQKKYGGGYQDHPTIGETALHSILQEYALALSWNADQAKKVDLPGIFRSLLGDRAANAQGQDVSSGLASEFKRKTLLRFRLLDGHGRHADSPLSFLHLTFQEYLTAEAMVRRVLYHTRTRGRKEGWEVAAKFLEKATLLPQWEETLLFFADILTTDAFEALKASREKDAVAYEAALFNLFTLLEDEKTDTITRDRLALAVHLLPETKMIWDSEEREHLLQEAALKRRDQGHL